MNKRDIFYITTLIGCHIPFALYMLDIMQFEKMASLYLFIIAWRVVKMENLSNTKEEIK